MKHQEPQIPSFPKAVELLRAQAAWISELAAAQEPTYLTAEQVEKFYDVTKTVLLRWKKAGRVKVQKTSRKKGAWTKYSEADVIDCATHLQGRLRKCRKGAPPQVAPLFGIRKKSIEPRSI